MASRNTIRLGDMVRTITALDRRLRALERSTQFANARITNTDGDVNFFWTTDTGRYHPWLKGSFQKANDLVAVTSGSWTSVWTSQTQLLDSPEVLFQFLVTTDSGTVGKVRVDVTGQATTTSEVTIPASTQDFIECRWAHGLTIGTGPFTFDVQAQRVSGSNNVNVYAPRDIHYGGNMSPVAGGLQ